MVAITAAGNGSNTKQQQQQQGGVRRSSPATSSSSNKSRSQSSFRVLLCAIGIFISSFLVIMYTIHNTTIVSDSPPQWMLTSWSGSGSGSTTTSNTNNDSSSSSSSSLSSSLGSSTADSRNLLRNTNDISNNENDASAPGPVSTTTTTTTRRSKGTIAYAVSVTGCGSDPITEGAAVLKHSIHLVSSRNNKSINNNNNNKHHSNDGNDEDRNTSSSSGGEYDYEMFAIYHPSAKSCALSLEELGYTLLERDTPIAVHEIEGEFLRTRIEKNGCCGEKELIKLYAYTLINYDIVVHLDLDVLVLKPLDELYNIMLYMTNPQQQLSQTQKQHMIMWHEQTLPNRIDAFYTIDYNMVNPHAKYKPVQGGFLVLRPSMDVFNEFKAIIKKGDFRKNGGWGGKVGPFYGSMTFQGLIPYYYMVLHPNTAVELNRCVYNQMCDNPRTGKTVNDVLSGDCRTGQDVCEDCRSRPIDDVVTMHATLCQKFWWCLSHSANIIQQRLCRKLTTAWYDIRSQLEQSWGRSGIGPGKYETDVFYGYCTTSGKNGYQPIQKPYGGDGSSISSSSTATS